MSYGQVDITGANESDDYRRVSVVDENKKTESTSSEVEVVLGKTISLLRP
jgi:hypothetical protein